MQLLYVLFSHTLNRTAERGQSTVEYIIVTFAAATLAGALVTVMVGMGKLASVFEKIVDKILGVF